MINRYFTYGVQVHMQSASLKPQDTMSMYWYILMREIVLFLTG